MNTAKQITALVGSVTLIAVGSALLSYGIFGIAVATLTMFW